MTDRNFVLKWGYMGLGRNPRYRHIIDEDRRALDAHIAEIQAEQEQRNAALHKIEHSRIPCQRIAARDAVGRARRHADFQGNRKDTGLDAVKTRERNRR
jgi:hypothetical protein